MCSFCSYLLIYLCIHLYSHPNLFQMRYHGSTLGWFQCYSLPKSLQYILITRQCNYGNTNNKVILIFFKDLGKWVWSWYGMAVWKETLWISCQCHLQYIIPVMDVDFNLKKTKNKNINIACHYIFGAPGSDTIRKRKLMPSLRYWGSRAIILWTVSVWAFY